MYKTHSPNLNGIVLNEAPRDFITGVAVVTAVRDDGRPVGMTINNFTPVSLTPPLLSSCISQHASTYLVFAATRHFCISVLTDDQADLTGHFSRSSEQYSHHIRGDGLASLIDGAFMSEHPTSLLVNSRLSAIA